MSENTVKSDSTPVNDWRTKHGYSGRPEYYCWSAMIGRCHNPNNPYFNNYGGRGITVCPQWRASFSAFIADVGDRPSPKHSLDRIDNNGNYEPGNVRWATKREQVLNMRKNVFLTFGGETLCLADWARRTGIRRSLLSARVAKGWSPAEILRIPERRPEEMRGIRFIQKLGKWIARGYRNKKQVHLGCFVTAEAARDAVRCYEQAAGV